MGFILGLSLGAIIFVLVYDLLHKNDVAEMNHLREENSRLYRQGGRDHDDAMWSSIEQHLRSTHHAPQER